MNFLLARAERHRENDIISKLPAFLDGEKTALDVGCGPTRLSARVAETLNLKIQGTDTWKPEKALVPFRLSKGKRLPFKANSFDSVFLFDVLHHVKGKEDRENLLAECRRVARRSVIIKDHYYSNFFQRQYLKAMDFFANLHVGVSTPFEFISRKKWEQMPFEKVEWWSMLGIPQVMMRLEK